MTDLPDWRQYHPLAFNEKPSEPMGDFIFKRSMPDGAEYYENERYQVTRRSWLAAPKPWRGPMIQLGISSADGTARHDWRDFQEIKNRFAGTEWEAVELYPAESRLLDSSNYYMLWCFESLPIGKRGGRSVLTPEESTAPQRGKVLAKLM